MEPSAHVDPNSTRRELLDIRSRTGETKMQGLVLYADADTMARLASEEVGPYQIGCRIGSRPVIPMRLWRPVAASRLCRFRDDRPEANGELFGDIFRSNFKFLDHFFLHIVSPRSPKYAA